MTWIDYTIIIAAVLVVAGVVISTVLRKKKGQTGCGCGCATCPSAGKCGISQKEKKDENA